MVCWCWCSVIGGSMRDIFSCMMVWFYVLVYFFLHYFTTKVCRSYSVWWKQVLVKKDPYKFLHGAPWKVLEEKTASIPAQGYYILILEFDFILDRIESAHHWIFVDVIIPPGL